MRKVRLLLLLLSPLLLAFQCDEDEDVAFTIPTGSWDLVKVSGGITGATYEFAEGVIVWTYNLDNTVSVVNNNTDEAAEDFFETGTYGFSYVPNDNPNSCSHKTVINDMDLGCQNIALPELTYTQLVADGYMLTLKSTEF